MLTNILIGLLCYSAILTLFLVCWSRHCKRMEAYDAAMDVAVRREALRKVVSAGVRPYPE